MRKNFEKLLKLAQENPELDILFFGNEDASIGEIANIQIEEYTNFFNSEYFHFSDEFEEEAMDFLYKNEALDLLKFSIGDNDPLCDEKVSLFLDHLRSTGKIKKAIFVYLHCKST